MIGLRDFTRAPTPTRARERARKKQLNAGSRNVDRYCLLSPKCTTSWVIAIHVHLHVHVLVHVNVNVYERNASMLDMVS